MDLELQGPAGRLEALLDEPEGARPLGACVVCHPHPLHQGTLRNTVVFRTARALRAAGLAALRFNFRGVGDSEGTHDGEGAEAGDVAAALDLLEARYPGLPLWAAGYSFGARTAAELATTEARIRRLILVALPVAHYDCSFLDSVTQPGLLIFGGGDDFGTASALAQRHPRLPTGLAVEEIAGADHMFRGRTPQLEDAVHTYALEHVRAQSLASNDGPS